MRIDRLLLGKIVIAGSRREDCRDLKAFYQVGARIVACRAAVVRRLLEVAKR